MKNEIRKTSIPFDINQNIYIMKYLNKLDWYALNIIQLNHKYQDI